MQNMLTHLRWASKLPGTFMLKTFHEPRPLTPYGKYVLPLTVQYTSNLCFNSCSTQHAATLEAVIGWYLEGTDDGKTWCKLLICGTVIQSPTSRVYRKCDGVILGKSLLMTIR